MEGIQLGATLPLSWWVFFGGGQAWCMFMVLWALPRVWHHEWTHLDRTPYSWRWGDAAWRGYVRALPASIMGFGVLSATVPLLMLFPEDPQGPFVRPYWFILLSQGMLIVPLLSMGTAILFNQPKFIVPPHLRAQPGMLAEWAAAWRARRGGWQTEERARLDELDRPLRSRAEAPGSSGSSSVGRGARKGRRGRDVA